MSHFLCPTVSSNKTKCYTIILYLHQYLGLVIDIVIIMTKFQIMCTAKTVKFIAYIICTSPKVIYQSFNDTLV